MVLEVGSGLTVTASQATGDGWRVRTERAAGIASAASSAFFFDVDGTLLELRAHPSEVVADADLRFALLAAVRASSGAVALISGRTLSDLDRIFAPLLLPAAGVHGGEIRFPDGTLLQPPSSLMDLARPALQDFVACHPGIWLEDKGATLAVHFRQRPELASTVLDVLSEFTPSDDIVVQKGKMVVELKPAQFDKGTAIAAFMSKPPFHGRMPVFFGDDLTDEAGFAYVNSAGGRSIRVGMDDAPTQAHEHLSDPAAMRAELAALANVLQVRELHNPTDATWR